MMFSNKKKAGIALVLSVVLVLWCVPFSALAGEVGTAGSSETTVVTVSSSGQVDTPTKNSKKNKKAKKNKKSKKSKSKKVTRTTILKSLNSAKKSSAIKGLGGAKFKARSKAGKRVCKALKALRKSSGTCAFAMVDLKTGEGISSSARQKIYAASTIKGPYMTALCKYRPGSITGSAREHMYQVMSWSSNTDYTALRHRFGASPMRKFLKYTDVHTLSPGRTWVYYTPQTLAKLWTGTYWYLFKDTNGRSSLLKRYAKFGARSFIKSALNSRKGYTTYTKTGWGPFSQPKGNIYDDAGIVYVKGHPYILAIMSKAYYHPSQLRALVRAIDAYHSYMAK